MARYKIKGLPPIRLIDLLKKRRITLQKFVKDSGISSYQTLLLKCEKMGVSAPDEKQFSEAVGGLFSSPQEGVIVLDPPDLVKDSGEKVKVDFFIEHSLPETQETSDIVPAIVEVAVTSTKSSKKSKKTLTFDVDVLDVVTPTEA